MDVARRVALCPALKRRVERFRRNSVLPESDIEPVHVEPDRKRDRSRCGKGRRRKRHHKEDRQKQKRNKRIRRDRRSAAGCGACLENPHVFLPRTMRVQRKAEPGLRQTLRAIVAARGSIVT